MLWDWDVHFPSQSDLKDTLNPANSDSRESVAQSRAARWEDISAEAHCTWRSFSFPKESCTCDDLVKLIYASAVPSLWLGILASLLSFSTVVILYECAHKDDHDNLQVFIDECELDSEDSLLFWKHCWMSDNELYKLDLCRKHMTLLLLAIQIITWCYGILACILFCSNMSADVKKFVWNCSKCNANIMKRLLPRTPPITNFWV